MDDKHKAELVMRAGQVMLESGAETSRVEDTMLYMLKSLNAEYGDVFVTTTGVFVCVNELTVLKRVTKRSINLNKICKINTLSRNLASGRLLAKDAWTAIEKIDSLEAFPDIVKLISCALCCFCYTYMLSRSFSNCIASFITGCILYITKLLTQRKRLSSSHTSFIGGSIAALSAQILCAVGIGSDVNSIIIASVMPLVPGVEFTNAVRDIVDGNYLSGSSRFYSAIVTGSAIAVGVAVVLKLCTMV